MSKEYSVLDIILIQKKKYIVLLSGLPFSPIEKIASELEKDFNATTLNFLHLDFNDDLSVINNRVSTLLQKSEPQPIFILAKSFPSSILKLPVDLHLNISLNKTLTMELDPSKTENLYEQYQEIIKTNRVNRYINIKKDYDLNEIILNIFNFIIDDIEKKVYGDKYDNLSSKAKTNTDSNEPYKIVQKPNSSKLVSDPNALSYQDKKDNALKTTIDDINSDIDTDYLDELVDKSDDDDVLSDELLKLGSRRF